MKDKIVDAYMEYRKIILDKFENPKHLQVVIQITPEALCKLRFEEHLELSEDFIYFTYLGGRKTPIIIKDDLPGNVEFIIQSQSDYERQEKEQLINKFFKMFRE